MKKIALHGGFSGYRYRGYIIEKGTSPISWWIYWRGGELFAWSDTLKEAKEIIEKIKRIA